MEVGRVALMKHASSYIKRRVVPEGNIHVGAGSDIADIAWLPCTMFASSPVQVMLLWGHVIICAHGFPVRFVASSGNPAR